MSDSAFTNELMAAGLAWLPALLLGEAEGGGGGTYAFGLSAAGTGQSDGTLISAAVSEFVSVSGAECAVLPVGVTNADYYLINAAGVSLPLFPAVGQQIEAYGLNVSVLIGAGGSGRFIWNGTIWRAR